MLKHWSLQELKDFLGQQFWDSYFDLVWADPEQLDHDWMSWEQLLDRSEQV